MAVSDFDGRHKALGLNLKEANWVLSICRKFLNRRDELEDLYQSALFGLYKAFSTAQARGKPIRYRGGFIYSVVVNTLVCHYAQRTRKDLLYHSLNVYEELPLDNYSAPESEISDMLVLQDLMQRILTPEEAQIVTWHYFEGRPQTEIAKRLGLSQSFISIRCSKIKEKLRAAFNEEMI